MRKFLLSMALVLLSGAAMAQTQISTINDLSNEKVYTLTSSRGTIIYNPENAQVLASTSFYSSFDISTNNAKWAIYKSETGKYYFYNIGAQKFLGNNSNEAGKYPWVQVPTNDVKIVESTKDGFPFVFSTDNYGAVNHFHPTSNHNAPGIANWKGNASNGGLRSLNDDGSAHTITEAGDIDAEMLENIARLVSLYENPSEISYTIRDDAGNIYKGTYIGVEGFSTPTITGAAGYTLSNEEWDGANYTATINFTYPMSNKDNGVTNETLLSMWNNNLSNGKFVRAAGENIKVQTSSVAAIDANCLWAIYPSFNNGAFTFTIMNIATGKYIYSAAENNSSHVGNDNTPANDAVKGIVVLSDTPSEFIIADDGNDFRFSDRANLYISINSTNNTDAWLGVHHSAHGGTNMYDVVLPQYKVAVTEAKYATFFAPYAVTVPDNVTAHTVTLNGNWAVLSEPLSVIPAYTGVVLYSETAQTYTFNVTTTDVTVENNALRGTVASEYVTANAYVLGIPEGETEVCFAKAVTEGQAAGTFLNNHHKAYLPAPAGSNIAAYSFRFGEGTTGIEEITDNREQSTVIYDLTGRRVEAITAPGIYVVNGKKVLVK